MGFKTFLLFAAMHFASSQLMFDQKEYYIEFESLAGNYHIAHEVCRIRGMSLVSITDMNVYKQLVRSIKSRRPISRGSSFYIGLQRITTTKLGLRWSDGSELESTYDMAMWAPGNPVKNPRQENCAVLNTNAYLLINTNCTTPGYFICQRPVNSSLVLYLLVILVGMTIMAGTCIMVFARKAGREPELSRYNAPRQSVALVMNLAQTVLAISGANRGKRKRKIIGLNEITQSTPGESEVEAGGPSDVSETQNAFKNLWEEVEKLKRERIDIDMSVDTQLPSEEDATVSKQL